MPTYTWEIEPREGHPIPDERVPNKTTSNFYSSPDTCVKGLVRELRKRERLREPAWAYKLYADCLDEAMGETAVYELTHSGVFTWRNHAAPIFVHLSRHTGDQALV